MTSINPLNDQKDPDHTGEENQLETLNREDKAVLTLIGYVRYHTDRWTKATVQDKAWQGDIRGRTMTFSEQINCTACMGD